MLVTGGNLPEREPTDRVRIARSGSARVASVAAVIDFEKHRIRSRIEAALLAAGDRDDTEVGRFRAEAIGALSGTVVEIGPGPGVNLHHYRPGTRVIAIEPNPVMRGRLTATAAAGAGAIDLDVRDRGAETIDVDDGGADAVVSTLVLCGVDDPAEVVAETRRVLRPGGRFVFVEHVAAPTGSGTARTQRLVRRPHRWMFNGCRVDQDTEAVIRSFDWADLELRSIDLGRAGAWVRHQIVGVATR